jgi:hypothetical protein
MSVKPGIAIYSDGKHVPCKLHLNGGSGPSVMASAGRRARIILETTRRAQGPMERVNGPHTRERSFTALFHRGAVAERRNRVLCQRRTDPAHESRGGNAEVGV